MSRTLLKTLTYRISSTAITVGATWIVTGQLVVAGAVGAVEFGAKGLFYYAHAIWEGAE